MTGASAQAELADMVSEAEPGAAHGEETLANGGPTQTPIVWDSGSQETAGKHGMELIQALVKRLPNAPGVYRMMNTAGDVLYVGKARSFPTTPKAAFPPIGSAAWSRRPRRWNLSSPAPKPRRCFSKPI
jgi:hypothetical protein